jgi:hypothetical protein
MKLKQRAKKNSLSGADNSKMRMVTPKILFEQDLIKKKLKVKRLFGV